MEIKQFGSITEEEGQLVISDFVFEGEGTLYDALLALRDYISLQIGEADGTEYLELRGITTDDLKWKFTGS